MKNHFRALAVLQVQLTDVGATRTETGKKPENDVNSNPLRSIYASPLQQNNRFSLGYSNLSRAGHTRERERERKRKKNPLALEWFANLNQLVGERMGGRRDDGAE